MLDVDPRGTGVVPVPAATVVLVRDAHEGVEVLLVQRHRGAAFMGGAYVFPGGKLDPADAADDLAPYLEGADDAALLRALGPSESVEPRLARALYVAAARETFEEAGILLGMTRPGEELQRARARLNGGASLREVLASLDARLHLGRLVPLARWVTPAVERRRFDARFFVAAMTAADTAGASAEMHETVASRWIRPRDAVDMHAAGEIDLPPPTLRTLEELMPHRDAAEIVRWAAARTVPFVRPVFHAPPGGEWILALPGDPEHPEPWPVVAGPTRFVCRGGRWYSA